MTYILDIILIAVILIIVLVAAKRGLVLTVFDIAAGIISFLFAKLIAPRAAVAVYDGHIKQTVLDFLSDKYAHAESAVEQAANSVFSFFDFLPEGVMNYAKSAGFLDSEAMFSNLTGKIATVADLESKIVSPVVIALLNILCFAVIAFVLLIVLKIVARLLAKLVTTAKIAKKLDSILGAAFGLVKGIIYVFIIAAILSVLSCSVPTLASYAADSYICAFASKLIGL